MSYSLLFRDIGWKCDFRTQGPINPLFEEASVTNAFFSEAAARSDHYIAVLLMATCSEWRALAPEASRFTVTCDDGGAPETPPLALLLLSRN
jgi:hypothetical protein